MPRSGGHPAALIPTRYARPETSGLTFAVQAGSQECDIDLVR